MNNQIEDADFVLCGCTPTYCRRVMGRDVPGRGLGVIWEGTAILNELYRGGGINTKFIPILFDPTDEITIPQLAGTTYYRVLTEEGYEDLLRHLTQQPRAERPALETLTPFPPQERLPDFLYPSHLPSPPTPLIGREREVEEVSALLSEDQNRVVTLTGPGGVGKSRLALAVAARVMPEFHDGAFVIDLSPVRDPALVATAIAEALDVPESPGESVTASLLAWLAGRDVLLILDTLEHLTANAADLVAQIVEGCPGVKILATSRERLAIRAERPYEVAPLPLPDLERLPEAAEQVADVGSVALFVDRAAAVQPGFQIDAGNANDVAEIVVRLDGLPLALELAAAWIDVLAASELLRRLEPRLPMLAEGPRDLPERQRTMEATIAWSYDLLTPQQQQVLRVLSVFPGSFTLEAAERVVTTLHAGIPGGLTEIRSLLRKSLLVRVDLGEGGPRFRMLDTIREYGQDRLRDSGEFDRADQAHARYLEELLFALAEPRRGTPDRAWMDQLETERDSWQAALAWAHSAGNGELLVRLVWNLWRFWELRGYPSEGRVWLERALAVEAPLNTIIRPDLLVGAGLLARMQGDFEHATSYYEGSLALWHELGDTEKEADTLLLLGSVAHSQERYADAIAWWSQAQALFQSVGSQLGIAKAEGGLGSVALRHLDRPRARQLLTASTEKLRELGAQGGGDEAALASNLRELGQLEQYEGNLERAIAHTEEALSLKRAIGDTRDLVNVLLSLARMVEAAGDEPRATAVRAESMSIARTLGDKRSIAFALYEHGHFDPMSDTARIENLQASLNLYFEVNDQRGIAEAAEGLARFGWQRDQARAVRLFYAARSIREFNGLAQSASERGYDDSLLSLLAAMLGSEAFEAAVASGSALTRDELLLEAQQVEAKPDDSIGPAPESQAAANGSPK